MFRRSFLINLLRFVLGMLGIIWRFSGFLDLLTFSDVVKLSEFFGFVEFFLKFTRTV